MLIIFIVIWILASLLLGPFGFFGIPLLFIVIGLLKK